MTKSKLPTPHPLQTKPFRLNTSLIMKGSSVLSSCRICLSSIFDPASLTCGHKFCESCLDRYWQVNEKPTYLTCPLCRAHAYNVDFTEKEEISSMSSEEFRKKFSLVHTLEDSELTKSTVLCFKITMLIPVLYYMLKWLKLPASELMSLLRCKMWYKM